MRTVRQTYILRGIVPRNQNKIYPFFVEGTQTIYFHNELFPGSQRFNVSDLYDICPQRSVNYNTVEELLEALEQWKNNWLDYLKYTPPNCETPNVERMHKEITTKINTTKDAISRRTLKGSAVRFFIKFIG